MANLHSDERGCEVRNSGVVCSIIDLMQVNVRENDSTFETGQQFIVIVLIRFKHLHSRDISTLPVPRLAAQTPNGGPGCLGL